jgi:hypothetical protein
VDDLSRGKSPVPSEAAQPRRLLVAEHSAQPLVQDWAVNAAPSIPKHSPATSLRA